MTLSSVSAYLQRQLTYLQAGGHQKLLWRLTSATAFLLLLSGTAFLSHKQGRQQVQPKQGSIAFGPNEWVHDRIQEAWVLGEGRQRDFVPGPLVFLNDTSTALRLGCPAHECGCFFNFTAAQKPTLLDKLMTQRACQRYKPLAADWGRPWCVCHVPEPEWLSELHPKPWRNVDRALILGKVTGANPTHQLHITFFWIWMWLVHIANLTARQVHLLVDCDLPDWCMGTYGIGLANALLSEPIWLPHSNEPLVVNEGLKFGLGGTFPYSLWEMQPFRAPLPEYGAMTQTVKDFYKVPDEHFDKPLRIVISQRPATSAMSTRVLRNTRELAASLKQRGFNVQVAEFGKMTFMDQLKTVQGAVALAGITGSDLVTGVFLPKGAAVIEMFPSLRDHQVINVEVHNIMRMAEMTYHQWHSPINADVLYGEDGLPAGNMLSHQIGQTDVDIAGGTASIEAAALQAAMLQTDRVGEIWDSKDPVNASAYPAPSLGQAVAYRREKEKRAKDAEAKAGRRLHSDS